MPEPLNALKKSPVPSNPPPSLVRDDGVGERIGLGVELGEAVEAEVRVVHGVVPLLFGLVGGVRVFVFVTVRLRAPP